MDNRKNLLKLIADISNVSFNLITGPRNNAIHKGKRINNPNTHGTGCTLSSAIASNLAKGYDLETSVQKAKDYISEALGYMLDLGQGSGPMNHAFDLNGRFAK